MLMDAQPQADTPVEIGRAGAHDLRIVWLDRHVSVYPARPLRLQCPCAACVDELTGEQRVEAAQVPQDAHPLRVEPVGRYGVSLQWSDGHRTGIYAFARLRAACPCNACQP
jgi:DUF971 family protein